MCIDSAASQCCADTSALAAARIAAMRRHFDVGRWRGRVVILLRNLQGLGFRGVRKYFAEAVSGN